MNWAAVLECLRLLGIGYAVCVVASLAILAYEIQHATPAGEREQL